MTDPNVSDDGLSDALLERAARLSAATLHEAAGRVGALPSSLLPIERSMRTVGRALPVRCPGGDNLWIHHALAQAETGDVLVVETGPNGADFGYWGEIMATAAQVRGIAGLVITGGVRDSLRLIEMGLPTFSSRITIRGTAKDPCGDGAVGEPVRIGDVVVRRGDLVFGDADGVVVLSPKQAGLAIPASEKRDADEIAIIEKLKGGALTLDVYKF